MKTKKEQQSGNDLIAKLMDREPINFNPSHWERNYHNDWNLLMGVIDKIENEFTWTAIVEFIQFRNEFLTPNP